MTTRRDRAARRPRGPAPTTPHEHPSDHSAGHPADGPAAPPTGAPPATPRESLPGRLPGRLLGPLTGRMTGGPHADLVLDTLLAVALAAFVLVTSTMAVQPQDRPLWPGGVALILAGTLIMAVRRRHPVLPLVVLTLVVPLYYPSGYPDGPLGVVLFAALFNTAVHCRAAVPLGAVIVTNAAIPLVSFIQKDDAGALVDSRAVASLTTILLVIIGAGMYVRNRRDRLTAAEARATAAIRDREAEAHRRATEERLRIARELHDVLAHQISLINVQAGAALHRRDDPDRAYEALDNIKTASKQTLRELRGVLGVLRQVDDDTSGPVTPAPSLTRLQDLLHQTTAAGLHVHLDTDLTPGQDPPLPAPVDLAGYRIIQEALTNAVRHSGAANATVTIRHTDHAVTVQIDDDGTGPDPQHDTSQGNGLRGMHERAAATGGHLTTGPAPGGGFRVQAHLPLDPPLPDTDDPIHPAGKDHT